MSTIIKRTVKGEALTWAEVDDNFDNLNQDKLETINGDAAPSLGGDLDTNNYSIISQAGNDITIVAGAGGVVNIQDTSWPSTSAAGVLTNDGAGNLSWSASTSSSINFDGGSPSADYSNGPAFDCGGVN